MDDEQLKTLSIRIAALVDALESRSLNAVQAVSDSGERLDHTARQLSNNLQRLAQDVTRTVAAETSTAMAKGMQQAFKPFAENLQQWADSSSQTAETLREQHEALRRVQRGLMWRSATALLLGTALAVGASGFMLWKSQQTMQEAQFSESILRATQTGAITQCEGQLCIRVPRGAPRFSRNNDFVLLQ